MKLDIIITIAVVACAAAYAVVRVVRTFRSKTPSCGCSGNCTACGKQTKVT